MLRRLLTALCVIATSAIAVAVLRPGAPIASAAEPVVLDVTITPQTTLTLGQVTDIAVSPPSGFTGRIGVTTPTICTGQGANAARITAIAVGQCLIKIECLAVTSAAGAAAIAAAAATSSSSSSSSAPPGSTPPPSSASSSSRPSTPSSPPTTPTTISSTSSSTSTSTSSTTTTSSSTTTTIGTTTTSTIPQTCRPRTPDVLVTVIGVPEYVPLVPTRVLETRSIASRGIAPIGGDPARTGVRPTDGERVRFKVAATVAATPATTPPTFVPPVGAEAVVLNVTGVDVSQDGFVTAWDCATDRPLVSNLNLSKVAPLAGDLADVDARANLVVTKMDAEGYVCLYVQHGTHLVADLNGYFPPSAPYLAKLPPERILETRPGEVGFVRTKPLPGDVLTVDLSGSVEAGTKAVVLNITGVNTDTAGFVTVWDCQGPAPTASNLNLPGGLHATPNLVVSRLSPTQTVCLEANVPTDLVVDLFGEFTALSKFTATQPARVLETRTSDASGPLTQVNYFGARPGAESIIRLTFANGAITTAGDKPDAVVLNVTGTEPIGPGFVTIWPCEETRPLASNVNMARLGAGANDFPAVSNLIIAKTDSTGSVCLYTQRGAHLVADLYGFFPFGSAGG